MVLSAVPPLHDAAFFKAIDEFYSTVMAKVELPGEGGDRGAGASRKAFYREEELVLVRLDALGTGGILAEVLEFPDAAAEFRKLTVTGFGNMSVDYFRIWIVFSGTHQEGSCKCIVSRWDLRRDL